MKIYDIFVRDIKADSRVVSECIFLTVALQDKQYAYVMALKAVADV